MKQIITILAIILLGGVSYGQDSTAVRTYGIELGSYQSASSFGGEDISATNTVMFVGYIENTRNESITFYYEVKSVSSDSVEKINKVRLELPQSYVINNKTALEWFESTVSSTDTTIFKGLAKPLYIEKILKKQ